MAEFDIKAIFKIEGLGELQKAFKGIGSAAGNVGKDFKAFTGAIGNTAKNVAKVAAVATGAVGAVVALTKSQGAAAEQTLNLSKATGVSTKDLQTYAQISEDAGVGQEAMARGLQQLNRRFLDLKDPTSASSKEIAKLDSGLAASLRTAKTSDDAFLILKNRLGEIGDESVRANIEFIAFGKAGQQLDPVLSMNNEQFAKASKAARDFGVVLSDLQLKQLAGVDESFDNVSTAVSGLSRGLAATLAPAVTEAANALAEFIKTNKDQIIIFVGSITSEVVPVVRDFFKLLAGGPELQNVNETSKKIYDGFILIKDAVTSAVTTAISAFNALAAAITPVAAFFGMSGKEFLITVSILQLLGVLKILTTGFSLLTSSVNLLLVSLKAAPAILTVLLNIFGKLGPILTLLTTGFRALWVAVTGPVGIAIAAITIFVGLIYTIVEATIGWDKALQLLGQAFAALGKLAFKIITEILSILISIPVAAVQIAGKILATFGQMFVGLLSLVTTAIAKIAIVIGTGFLKAFEGIKAGLTAIVQFALQKGREIFDGIINSIKTAVLNVVKSISDAIKSIFDGVKNTFNSIINTITSAINKVKSAVSSVASAVTGSGSKKKVTTTTRAPGLASGGLVGGVGGPTSDNQLLWGSPGEFMIKARTVRKFGVDFFHRLNSGILPAIRGFADGGLIGGLDGLAASAMGSPAFATPVAATSVIQGGGRPLHLHLPDGRVIKAKVDNDTARNLEKSMRRSDNAKAARLPGWYQ